MLNRNVWDVNPDETPPQRGEKGDPMSHERAEDEFPEPVAVRPDRQGIQSVENAAAVLGALEAVGGPATLGEIAALAGAQPNKIHRYLVSLVRVGLAVQSPISGRYDLGPMVRRLGAAALRRTNDVTIAADHSRTLRDACGQSVNVAVWGDSGPVIVRWDYGLHALPLTVRVGTTLSLLGSSSGRVFLSHLPRQMTADALTRSLATYREPLDEAGIDEIIATVRSTGVAVATGAIIPGATSISAPIFTASDSLPLAMTVVLPGESIGKAELQSVASQLRDAAQRVSDELGGDTDQTGSAS
jgi:DNA-binding IclR family transcriptional regulator